MSEKPMCKTCPYWHELMEHYYGLCRRSSPGNFPGDQDEAMWPTVNTNDWCGEHPEFGELPEFKREKRGDDRPSRGDDRPKESFVKGMERAYRILTEMIAYPPDPRSPKFTGLDGSKEELDGSKEELDKPPQFYPIDHSLIDGQEDREK